jgi:hypothetical protein
LRYSEDEEVGFAGSSLRGVAYAVLLVCFVVPVPALLMTGFSFGHTNAVEEQVDELDRMIRERRRNDTSPTGGGNGNRCLIDYPDWLEDVDDRADLRTELLEPDTRQITPTSSPSSLAVKGDSTFREENPGGVTADTILKRCNMHFRDKNDSDLQHWVYCRALQLPSGDTYTDLDALRDDPDSAPAGLYTAAFFHGSNVDDPSENWLVPLIDQYKKGCHDRPLNIIWVGVWVRDLSVDPPDYKLSLGNDWHVTASAWENTVLFDVMEPSQLNFSGHSTASCPFDSTDTHGLWVGGTAEEEGRRITNKYTDQQALWVGDNSINQSACYSGVTDGNPVNANDHGVQFEYQVLLPDGSDTQVQPESIAESVLEEF